jgi:hypothetical protein
MSNLLIGRSGNLALYANESVGAVIDTTLGIVVETGPALELFQARPWEAVFSSTEDSESLLASKALETHVEEALIASADRMYSIPKSVQAEAIKALEWHKEHHRGGTPVGLNTARILAKGGQIGIRKVRHIAKYFPRHEVDKKGKGWKPGQDNFPSNGRIAWALWGGDAGRRWASTIVKRDEKAALTASGYAEILQPNIDPFKQAQELDENYGPEFMARVDMNGGGIDRLYKIDIDNRVYVWDDECWDDLGSVDGDAWTYDKALDDPYHTAEKLHVLVDPSSALMIAARLALNPEQNVSVYDLDQDEAALVELAMGEIDWDMVDLAITAAGAVTNQDGNYTPEERSQKAQGQIRDASGKFASAGSRVVVSSDTTNGKGLVTNVNKGSGTATVKMDSGDIVEVDTKATTKEEDVKEAPAQSKPSKALDTSGILGQPKKDNTKPKAILKDKKDPLTGKEVQKMLDDWKAGVVAARAKAGVTAAGTSEDVAPEQTPEKTDVEPKYIAIVSPTAPDAVLDLVAIVPKTATTTEPATYRRDEGKWVYDEQILNDLTSATPPPVIELDKLALQDTLAQVDENSSDVPKTKTVTAGAVMYGMDRIFTSFYEGSSLIAAGGLDRNRGNAEELRRYWVHGEGAAKIRWGTPGDWKRCVRYLSKHLGPRAKGYCQLRHKDALGYYTATHAKRDRQNG